VNERVGERRNLLGRGANILNYFFVGLAFFAEKACGYWGLSGFKKNELKSMSEFRIQEVVRYSSA
jgi:hypothetical protein